MSDTENLPALLREDARHHLDVAQQCDCDPMDTVNWQHMQNALRAADEIERLRKDAARLDWLADPDNGIAQVLLPTECVKANLHSLRDAIDMAIVLTSNIEGGVKYEQLKPPLRKYQRRNSE